AANMARRRDSACGSNGSSMTGPRGATGSGWQSLSYSVRPNEPCSPFPSRLWVGRTRLVSGPPPEGCPMTRMTDAAAAALDPAQAAALAQVLGLQAQWQNLRDDGRDYSTARLHGLQRTFEAFR